MLETGRAGTDRRTQEQYARGDSALEGKDREIPLCLRKRGTTAEETADTGRNGLEGPPETRKGGSYQQTGDGGGSFVNHKHCAERGCKERKQKKQGNKSWERRPHRLSRCYQAAA